MKEGSHRHVMEDAESYDQFIERVETNPIARKVKIADLKDNMNLERIS